MAKAITLSPPRRLTEAEWGERNKRDPGYPPSYRWVVFDNKGTSFADESPEGALALAKQYHRMK